MYGVASIENCNKTAFIHYSVVTEPAKRGRGRRRNHSRREAKLKCTTKGDWPIVATNEPIKSHDEVDAWSKTVKADWESKGFEVKQRRKRRNLFD